MRLFFLATGILLLQYLLPQDAFAHAFGERYDLPLPLHFYLTGAGATVALSFIIIVFFFRHPLTDQKATITVPLGKPLIWAGYGLKAISLFIFSMIFATGFYGVNDSLQNFASVFVWVIWWVGMAFACAMAGNLWELVNPWATLFKAAQSLTKKTLCLNCRYPARLGCWPAVTFMFIWAWLELVSGTGELPRTIALYALIYSVITWAGMFVFGLKTWLQKGEVFSLFFGTFAKFAPLAVEDKNLILRPYSTGLIQKEPTSASMLFFVILLLSIVSLDGFMETGAWQSLLQWISENQAMRPALLFIQAQGFDLLQMIKLCALLIAPLLFLVFYMATCFLISCVDKAPSRTPMIAGYLVLSLVPIAVAYHLAHYVSYLLIAGQNVIPLLSDPFGFGWDIFGTANHKIDITVISTKFIWFFSMIIIVLGHLAAVYVAHMSALNLHPSPKKAVIGQIPMLFLMVAYTMTSLWILSQPIVE